MIPSQKKFWDLFCWTWHSADVC